MTRYLLVGADSAFAERLRRIMASENSEFSLLGEDFLRLGPAEMADFLTADPAVDPDLLILGPRLSSEAALPIARVIDERCPGLNVVLFCPPDPALTNRAMRAGVRDLLAVDSSDTELRASLESAAAAAARRRSQLGGSLRRRRRVITVISPKGGTGKTMLATNLAAGLGNRRPNEVVIADLDLLFGDVANALRLLPEHTMADISANLATLDPIALKVLLTPHADGLFALCAPDSPAQGELVPTEATNAALRMLAAEFPYLIVDTAAGLNEHTLRALEVSTDIVLACTMDVLSVRSLEKVVAALDGIGMTTQRRHFVLNRSDSRVGLNASDLEQTLGMTVDAAIPSSRLVPVSLNEGVPIITADSRSAVARRLTSLVDRFTDQPANPRRLYPGRRWWRH